MTHAASPPIRQAAWLALASLLATATNPAWSTDNTASLALTALLGPQAVFQQAGGLRQTAEPSVGSAAANTAMAGASAPTSAVSGTVTVQRGETLDRLIRRALPDVPLHPDFLRKAFVTLNPQAFPSGSPHQMRSGTILQVPSTAALRQMLLAQYPASVALLNNVGGQSAERAAAQQDSKEPKRWVRFP